MTRLADVEAERVQFLWEPYLILGKLALLIGDPGLGKTFLALALCSAVTRGDPFAPGPGQSSERREPANVVYLTAEDGLGDTIRPRLDAMGADVERFFALEGFRDAEGQRREVSLSDLPVLEETLSRYSPQLVVVDPLQAFLGAGVDMHRANEVRPVLAGLAKLAARYDAAFLAIGHLRKSESSRAVYRGLGSIDFAAAVRSILLVGRDPRDERRRVLVHTKSNLAPEGPSLGFEVADGFFWTGASDATAEQVLAAPRSAEERSAEDEAADYLRESLREGQRPAKALLADAKRNGIAEITLRRAKTRLGVVSRRGLNGSRNVWLWSLPEGDQTRRGEHDDHLPFEGDHVGAQDDQEMIRANPLEEEDLWG